jgi:hypothetical protein
MIGCGIQEQVRVMGCYYSARNQQLSHYVRQASFLRKRFDCRLVDLFDNPALPRLWTRPRLSNL